MQHEVQTLPGTLAPEFFATENAKSTIDDWRYEMRREMQEIVTGLFLGPFSACKDTDKLHKLGISHILCFLDQNEFRLFRSTATLANQFVFKVVEVFDSPMQNLIPLFPQSTTYIRDVIEKNGKILVCCNGGMSRSPAFVIAYTMETFGLNAVQAYQYVQSRRLCINPNETFRSQLGEYEPIYKARQINGVPNPADSHEQQNRRRRRSSPDNTTETDPKRRSQGDILDTGSAMDI
ncbi:protein-tyrosine phosphatase-like protein [Syncephalastrum racemosum]|uniref:Protein-tyrosine phosphatase-like protein n=1 Tax=Syncephalastrum racemosum TaxID=13706 RepID=A0A1X2HL98_SYNRA|nr:protein-tyrosine phosphatase-like protein [Syncephalastrum racemosum]